MLLLVPEEASNYTCKCKEQEWKISSSAPRWNTWLSFGFFSSYRSCFWYFWCSIQFYTLLVFKTIYPNLVWPIGGHCYWWCSEKKETYSWWWSCTVKIIEKKIRSSARIKGTQACNINFIYLWEYSWGCKCCWFTLLKSWAGKGD